MRGRKCGTRTPEASQMARVERGLAVHLAKEAAAPAAPKGPVAIPTHVFVVLAAGSSIGNVSNAVVRAQLDMMNKAYATGASPAASTWKFVLSGVSRVVGPNMCDEDGEAKVKAAHHVNKAGHLNLYFTDLSPCGLLGYSTWPWDVRASPGKDGVVIHYDTMPGGGYRPYNMGRTTVHETGHWLGLYHTFQNGCTNGGDQVQDTPYSASPTEGCPQRRDSCSQPGLDPISNFLDYTDDACMKTFTAQQHTRALSMFKLHRASSF